MSKPGILYGAATLSGIPEELKPYLDEKLFDMAGNVWEWTNSDYDEKSKVVKSGSWGLSHKFAQTFIRIGYEPTTKTNNIGFRCAKDK